MSYFITRNPVAGWFGTSHHADITAQGPVQWRRPRGPTGMLPPLPSRPPPLTTGRSPALASPARPLACPAPVERAAAPRRISNRRSVALQRRYALKAKGGHRSYDLARPTPGSCDIFHATHGHAADGVSQTPGTLHTDVRMCVTRRQPHGGPLLLRYRLTPDGSTGSISKPVPVGTLVPHHASRTS